MALSRHDIHDDQSRHGPAPSEFAPIFKELIDATLAAVDGAPLSVRARALRTDAAARYISVDPDTLVQWRREGKGPIFKKIGSRCIYLVEALDKFLDALPVGNKPAGAGA